MRRGRWARRLIRLGLTPVLEGARAAWGGRGGRDAVPRGRRRSSREVSRAADAGIAVAIENHQDFGSEELVAMAERAGENVGVVMDTGNPFAVGEDPVAFARRVAASDPPRAPQGLPRTIHRRRLPARGGARLATSRCRLARPPTRWGPV